MTDVTLLAIDVNHKSATAECVWRLARRLGDRARVTVVASSFEPAGLGFTVNHVSIPAPTRPFFLRYLFYILGSTAYAKFARPSLTHGTGANSFCRLDVSTVHFCHAGFARQPSALLRAPGSPLRRTGQAIAKWMALRLERWAYRPDRTQHLIAVSEGLAEELVREYSFPRERIHVIPNGIDHERFNPSAKRKRAAVRKSLGILERTMLAVFVGGDWGRKRLDLAIRAIGMASAKGSDVGLLVLGSGDERFLRQHAEVAGVKERVWWLGHQADPSPYYGASDVFLLPSEYEAFSLAVLEAAAVGLPIVATPFHGATEVVRHGRNGFLVRADTYVIGGRLRELARSRALRNRMGKLASRAVATLTWENHARQVESLYTQILREKGREVGSGWN